MKRLLRHPSRVALSEWLTGEGDAGIDAHIGTCDRCALVLEGLDESGFEHSALGDALAAALAPPTGLTDRLEKKVISKLSNREMLDIIVDLFGAGLDTTKILLSEDDPRDSH